MRFPRFTTLQLMLGAALVALVLGLVTSAWRQSAVNQVEEICFSPSGKYLAARYWGGAVQVWRVDQPAPRLIAQAAGRSGLLGYNLGAIHFVADQRLLVVDCEFVSAGVESVVRELNPTTRKVSELMRINGLLYRAITQAANVDRLLVADESTAAILDYDLHSRQLNRRINLGSPPAWMTMSADGGTIAVMDQAATVHVLDVGSGKTINKLPGMAQAVPALSADGSRLAVPEVLPGSRILPRQNVVLFDVRSGMGPDRLRTQLMSVTWMAFSGDGTHLAVADWGNVEYYDLATKELVRRIALDGMHSFSLQIALAPDGATLATCDGRWITLRDLATGKVRQVITSGSPLIHVAIFTIGFAVWAAAWGIVGRTQREREAAMRAAEEAAGGLRLTGRTMPKVQRPWTQLGAAGGLILASSVPYVLLSTWQNPLSISASLVHSLAVMLAFLVAVLVGGIIYAAAVAVVKGPHYLSLLRLRQLSGDAGRLHEYGKLKLWFVGPSRIEGEFPRHVGQIVESARKLFGPRLDFDRPTLIACLDRQCDFDAFHFRRMPVAAVVPNRWTARLAVVCEETATRQLIDPLDALRSAVALVLLIQHKRGILPGWAGLFATQAITRNHERPAAVRGAIRRLRVLAARRPDWNPATILRRMPAERTRLWFASDRSDAWQEVLIETDLILTLGEMLLGPEAVPSRRDQVLNWLRALAPKDDPVKTLEQHLGAPLADLLAAWWGWLKAHHGLPYAPAPAFKRTLIRDCFAPLVQNRLAPRDERLRAVRQLGACGYLAAVGVLVEQLGERSCPFRDEVAEALEKLSGQMLGGDPLRWQKWWESLPAHLKQEGSGDRGQGTGDRGQETGDGGQETVRPQIAEPTAPLPPPIELKVCWGLMVVGGLTALAIPISLLFLIGPWYVTVYFSVLVGVAAIARGAARDTIGLANIPRLQYLNLLACDPVNLVLAAMEQALLRRPAVREYLVKANGGP